MRNTFPLFQSHLDLAHRYWEQLLTPGDLAIDATCGNGNDTLKLCQLALSADKGKIYAFDIQDEAIASTRSYLAAHLPENIQCRVELERRCHAIFPETIKPQSIKLIVYNLGYLPGGNKALTTQTATTLESLHRAQDLLIPGGVISITCYPGHAAGALEQGALIEYAEALPPKLWSCCHHLWLNRRQTPSLLLIQKTNAGTVA